MTVLVSPFGPKPQFLLADGTPAVGNQLFFYVAGSVNTKQDTFTDYTGGSANSNPIVLNALGEPDDEIWFTAGELYKVVYAPSTDTDPPTSPIWTIDYLAGINDTTVTIDQWVSGPAPTFVNATTFTLVGDQTSIFQVARRIKSINTGGTAYSTIATSVFTSVTTVTVVNDSTELDSGLSAVSYGLLSADDPSIPEIISGSGGVTVTYSGGKPTISSSAGGTGGGCRLAWTNSTTLTLAPYNGNQVVINSTSRTLQDAGATLSNGGTTISTRYYIYANWGEDSEVHMLSSTTVPVMQAGTGIMILTGNADYSYVGSAYISAAGTWVDFSVSSWFNHPNRVVGAATATTSGTSIDKIGFPPSTTEIKVTFAKVSTTGTDPFLIQARDANGLVVTLYNGGGAGVGAPTIAPYTAGIGLGTEATAARLYSGTITLSLQDAATFTWSVTAHVSRDTDGQTDFGAGSIALSAAITGIRATTTAGSATFDAGTLGVSSMSEPA